MAWHTTIAAPMTFNTPVDWTLKALKHNETLSDETHCFSANLYINNKKIAEISNHGHGGDDTIRWMINPEQQAKLLKTIEHMDEFDPLTNFSIIISDMVNEALLDRQIKRFAKKRGLPIGVYAEDAKGGFLFAIRTIDDLPRALDHHSAITYRVVQL